MLVIGGRGGKGEKRDQNRGEGGAADFLSYALVFRKKRRGEKTGGGGDEIDR